MKPALTQSDTICAENAALDALGSPVRRQIIGLLSLGQLSVSEISTQLPVSRPAVSRHLRLLSKAGLVAHDQDGTSNLYRLDARGFQVARGWLESFWDEALLRFKLIAENTRKGVANE